LVATGKSSVSRALAERLGAARLEADRVHDDLLHEPGDRRVHEARWWRSFAHGFEDAVYAELGRRADERLAAGEGVVLDGCFARAHHRLEARALARARGLGFLFVECRVPPEVARLRLAARDAESERPAWQAIYDDLAERWQPVTELPPHEHLVVQSDGVMEDVLAPVLATLSGGIVARKAEPAGRVVTFDCWNTLLQEADWPVAHALRVEQLRDAARETGRVVARDDAERAFDRAWSRHMELWEQGVASGAREVAQRSLAELGLESSHPALEHLVLGFEEASHSSRVTALEGARETLTALDRAGVPCSLICDTGLTPGRVVRRHLDREGLLSSLSVQSFSDEVGVPKPDGRAFAAALEPLAAAPEISLHVGDLRRTDVAGARALGMTSIRIRQLHDDSNPLPDADHVVDSHAHLLALLAELGILG
jgi:putative hydrolase of the HAD superfamily